MEGLTGEFGLRLLASDIAPGGEPELIASPVKAVPDDNDSRSMPLDLGGLQQPGFPSWSIAP
jgi:hypothetical protein